MALVMELIFSLKVGGKEAERQKND